MVLSDELSFRWLLWLLCVKEFRALEFCLSEVYWFEFCLSEVCWGSMHVVIGEENWSLGSSLKDDCGSSFWIRLSSFWIQR